MTPRDVDQLSDPEYDVMLRYANSRIREHNREARKAARR